MLIAGLLAAQPSRSAGDTAPVVGQEWPGTAVISFENSAGPSLSNQRNLLSS